MQISDVLNAPFQVLRSQKDVLVGSLYTTMSVLCSKPMFHPELEINDD
jgi:hypothetical protein